MSIREQLLLDKEDTIFKTKLQDIRLLARYFPQKYVKEKNILHKTTKSKGKRTSLSLWGKLKNDMKKHNVEVPKSFTLKTNQLSGQTDVSKLLEYIPAFQFQGNTLIHMFATHKHELVKVLEHFYVYDKSFLSAIVMKNDYGQSPFEMTLESNLNENTEIMLNYLSELKENRYSHLIYPHFQLLQMRCPTAFNNFLNSCTFKTGQMKEITYLPMRTTEKKSNKPISAIKKICNVKSWGSKLLKCFDSAYGSTGLKQDTCILFSQNKSILDYDFYKDYTSIEEVIKSSKIELWEKSGDSKAQPESHKSQNKITPAVKKAKAKHGSTPSMAGLINSSDFDNTHTKMNIQEEVKAPINSKESNSSSASTKARKGAKESRRKQDVKSILMQSNNAINTNASKKEDILQMDLEERRKVIKEIQREYQCNTVKLNKVNIKLIEFDWLFDGNVKNNFFNLINKENYTDILKIDVIRWILLFQWEHYRFPILLLYVLPLLCYHMSFIYYATFVITPHLTDLNLSHHAIYHIVTLVIVICLMCYNIVYEVRQSYDNISAYFRSIKNWLDL